MKKILSVAVLMIMASNARAAVLTNAQAVKVVVPYQMTCSSMTLGASASEITGNTSISTSTAGISWVRVVNLDGSNTVYCSHSASVAASGNNIGEPISPSSSGPKYLIEWRISTGQPWYCIPSAANTSVIVCKLK